MTLQATRAPAKERLTVEVSDPIGQQQVLLEGVRPTATVNEIMARAMSEFRLPPHLAFNLREHTTSRLLPDEQPIGEVAGEEAPHVRVTMQPDAGLG
jgi:hypothetical protein